MHNLDEPVVVVYLSWGTKDNKDDPTKGADFFKVRFFLAPAKREWERLLHMYRYGSTPTYSKGNAFFYRNSATGKPPEV